MFVAHELADAVAGLDLATIVAGRPRLRESDQVGDEIEVQVLEVDLDRERISLSLKATQQDP